MNKSILRFITHIILEVMAIVTITSCGSTTSQSKNLPVIRDTTITTTNAYSTLDLDSTMLDNYILKNDIDSSLAKKMRDFYKSRNYHFAWFSADGLTEQARAFYNLHNTYINAAIDTTQSAKELHATMDSLLNDNSLVLSTQEVTKKVAGILSS